VANDVTSNPWTLDTVGAVAPFALSRIKIHHFEFVGYAVATDIARLLNRNGDIVWEAQGRTDFSVVKSDRVGWVSGLSVDTLSDGQGKVLVYIAP
jgi:hypothetical protein